MPYISVCNQTNLPEGLGEKKARKVKGSLQINDLK